MADNPRAASQEGWISERNLSGHRLGVDFDVREGDGAGGAVPAAGRQVRHSDLVDLGEIRILHFDTRNDLLGIQLEPLQVVEGELDLEDKFRALVYQSVVGPPTGVPVTTTKKTTSR